MSEIDVAGQLAAIHREVQLKAADTAPEGGDVVAVLLRREYTADAADVWDALTAPDRLRRWFLPVTGDLRLGGTFQTEGNAGGEILTCDAPRLLRVTWGDAASIVALRLTALDADRTAVELEHTVPVAFAGGGAGALYVGPGWDHSLLALDLHLTGHPDPSGVESGPQGPEIGRRSIAAWVEVVRASGTATADEVAAGEAAALAQFAPAPQS
ncbi:SRPBCC domain-containing protein [Pseudonocardia sp. S2-4]|uniref:SRPBCC domain-containing protein n=2 Tax=Pseudonocardia humida TaxID=2800819 RepID=A0ABT0ZU96_9PSEU|nr:SRPBCC domain-containing protein [Pseudonocardia humida]